MWHRRLVVRAWALALVLLALVAVSAWADPSPSGAGGFIAGRVTDSSGRALPGMRVLSYVPGQSTPTAIGTSGDDGRYVISSLTPGTYDVAVLDGLLEPDKQTVTVAPAATTPYNPRLPAPLIPGGISARNAARDLRRLNIERAAAGLPAGIVQNTRWSDECAAHDAYEYRNRVLTHYENPHGPGASVGGYWVGQSSVLSAGAAWLPGHNPWDNAPIHLIQLFSPSLSVIGVDESRGLACATTWPGMLRTPPAHDTVSTYPGNGVTGVPPSENARESPFVPGDFVGIPQGRTAGRELFVYLNRAGQTGQAQVRLLSATLTGPRGRVSVRWVDNSTGEIGPDLTGAIIIPVRPLASRAHYTATVALRDGNDTISHAWSFTTARRTPPKRGSFRHPGAATPEHPDKNTSRPTRRHMTAWVG